MKKLVLRLLLVSFLATSMSAFAQDHDAVTDSLSIDDMAPVLYDEDAYEEEEESSNGVVIAIVIGVVVIAGIGVVVAKKKKK